MSFPNLNGHQFMLLTTFRKTGVPVPTPLWFAVEGDRLYAITPAKEGKVKRARNNPAVTVAPCTFRGQVIGDVANARVTGIYPCRSPEGLPGDTALNRKYGWKKVLGFGLFNLPILLRGQTPDWVIMEMVAA